MRYDTDKTWILAYFSLISGNQAKIQVSSVSYLLPGTNRLLLVVLGRYHPGLIRTQATTSMLSLFWRLAWLKFAKNDDLAWLSKINNLDKANL